MGKDDKPIEIEYVDGTKQTLPISVNDLKLRSLEADVAASKMLLENEDMFRGILGNEADEFFGEGRKALAEHEAALAAYVATTKKEDGNE